MLTRVLAQTPYDSGPFRLPFVPRTSRTMGKDASAHLGVVICPLDFILSDGFPMRHRAGCMDALAGSGLPSLLRLPIDYCDLMGSGFFSLRE